MTTTRNAIILGLISLLLIAGTTQASSLSDKLRHLGEVFSSAFTGSVPAPSPSVPSTPSTPATPSTSTPSTYYPPGAPGNYTVVPLETPLTVAIRNCHTLISRCCGAYCNRFSGCDRTETCDSTDLVVLYSTETTRIYRSEGEAYVSFDANGCPIFADEARRFQEAVKSSTWFTPNYNIYCPSIGDETCRGYYDCNFQICAKNLPAQCLPNGGSGGGKGKPSAAGTVAASLGIPLLYIATFLVCVFLN